MTITPITKPIPAPEGRRWNPETKYGRVRAQLLKTTPGMGFHVEGTEESGNIYNAWIYRIAKEIGVEITARKSGDGWDVWRVK